MESWFQDLRVSLRNLSKRPGFALVVALTLALGVGANAAIFSVVDAVLIRPLPYPEPEKLVRLWSAYPEDDERRGTSSELDLDDWREQNDVFDAVAAYPGLRVSGYVMTGVDNPDVLETAFVTPDFFEVFRVPAALGRTLTDGDHVEGENRVLVLSDGAWRRRFGADPGMVGRTIVLRDQPFTVIGVMPPRFDFPSKSTEIWVPLSLIPETGVPRLRGVRWLNVVARRKAGLSLETAEAEMSSIAARLAQTYPESNQRLTAVAVRPLDAALLGDIRPALLIVFAAVGLVLLVVCANVANLMLVRSEGRSREIAIRAALGSGRWRIARALVTESLLLSGCGGVLGLVLAELGLSSLLAMAPTDIPRLDNVSIDATVLGFTFFVSVIAGILVAVAPALRILRLDLNDRLKERSRGAGSGARGERVKSALVVAEVALVVFLATGATLLVRSYARLQNVDPGLVPANLLTLDVTAQMYKYPSREQYVGFFTRVLERLREVPGVRSAGLIRPFPLRYDTFEGEGFSFQIVGRPDASEADEPKAAMRFTSPGYFQTMGIPLLSGRDFDERDDSDAPLVAIVDRLAAERYWPSADPVGQRIRGPHDVEATIVGVVGDVKQKSLAEQGGPSLYLNYLQNARVGMTFVLRTAGDPTALIDPVKRAIREVDPDQPIQQIATMENVLADAVARPRFSMALVATFAALALALAAIGIYGVVSYTVAQQTYDFGVRLAFGARRADVVRLVLREGLVLTALGVLVGVGLSVLTGRFVSSLLFEIHASDPASYLIVIAILTATSLAACLIPALRAARTNPLEALHYE